MRNDINTLVVLCGIVALAASVSAAPVPVAKKPVAVVKPVKAVPAAVIAASPSPAIVTAKPSPFFSQQVNFQALTASSCKATTPNTPAGLIAALNGSSSLLCHAKLLQQVALKNPGAKSLSPYTQALRQRYLANENNPTHFFDYGWAQWVFNQQQASLFYMRKANDALATSETALLYAIAQAECDRVLEKAPLGSLTPRKRDVMYLVEDSLTRLRQKPSPGIWPLSAQFIAWLQPDSAYTPLTQRELSSLVVPYGKRPDALPLAVAQLPRMGAVPGETRLVTLTPNEPPLRLSFVPLSTASSANGFKITLQDMAGLPFLETTSPKAPYIIENIDKDPNYELVIRDAIGAPGQPVRVYRKASTGGVVRDTKIDALFE